MSKKLEPDHEEYLDDVELWETKQLGADPKYARRVSREKAQEIDDSLGLQAISIRLQKELVEQIKELARQDGIGYQPYIRQLLTRHVRESSAIVKQKKARA